MVEKSKNPIVATAAGAVAGGIETFTVWPMEYVKTQLQLIQKVKNPPFTGVISCAKYTYQTKGFFSFYTGLTPVLIGSIPKAGIRFGLFDFIKQKLKKADGSTTAARTLFSGMVAGAVEATLIVTPVETIKTRNIHSNEGFYKGSVRIFQTEGIKGFYRGAAPTIFKQSSNQGLRFMAFGQYRAFLTKDDPNRKLKPYESLIGGMFSGCFSTLLNNPFDFIKTRLQGEDALKYKGFADCFQKVVQNEGILALWNGVVPRLSRVVPGQGVIFMSYEGIQTAISNLIEDQNKI